MAGLSSTAAADGGPEQFFHPREPLSRLGAEPAAVRPEDEAALISLLQKTSKEDLRLRFFAPMKEFTHPFVARRKLQAQSATARLSQ